MKRARRFRLLLGIITIVIVLTSSAWAAFGEFGEDGADDNPIAIIGNGRIEVTRIDGNITAIEGLPADAIIEMLAVYVMPEGSTVTVKPAPNVEVTCPPGTELKIFPCGRMEITVKDSPVTHKASCGNITTYQAGIVSVSDHGEVSAAGQPDNSCGGGSSGGGCDAGFGILGLAVVAAFMRKRG